MARRCPVECSGGQASSHFAEVEADPTGHGHARVSPRPDFSSRLFRGEPSGHSRLVRTFFGQDDRPLYEDVAPASRAGNGESEAVAGSKLDPSWTPTGGEEGVLVQIDE
jgi:hypothetical protein